MNSAEPPSFIHPFLPDITEYLKSIFVGSMYEKKLFTGNFVDRCDVFSPFDAPKDPLWDPLEIMKKPKLMEQRKIYCVLSCTVNLLDQLKKKKNPPLSQKTKYYLTLFEDMHIPLINYIDKLVKKQKMVLDIVSYLHPGTEKLLIPEFQLEGPCEESDIKRIMKLKSYQRLNKLIKIKPFILTDEYLCTQIKLSDGSAIQPPAIRLQPMTQLFEDGEIFHEGLLPDVLRHVINCNFFNETKKVHPLVHLISKSLPQRCTIRNLADILHDYSKKHDYVYDFFIACMKASLLGLYKNTIVRPPFHVRKVLIHTFQTKFLVRN